MHNCSYDNRAHVAQTVPLSGRGAGKQWDSTPAAIRVCSTIGQSSDVESSGLTDMDSGMESDMNLEIVSDMDPAMDSEMGSETSSKTNLVLVKSNAGV